MAKSKKYPNLFHIRLSDNQFKKLTEIAEQTQLSMTDVIRESLAKSFSDEESFINELKDSY